MEKNILECRNLNKKKGKRQILKNVSFNITSGEIVGFIGANGARENYNNKDNFRTSKIRFRRSIYKLLLIKR